MNGIFCNKKKMNNVGCCLILIFTFNETPKHITLRDKSNDQFELIEIFHRCFSS